jgi:hypothetical protein
MLVITKVIQRQLLLRNRKRLKNAKQKEKVSFFCCLFTQQQQQQQGREGRNKQKKWLRLTLSHEPIKMS